MSIPINILYRVIEIVNNCQNVMILDVYKRQRHGIMLHQDVHHATVMANKLDTTYAFTHYYPYLQTLLMTMDREDIKAMLMVEEGMEQLLQKNAALDVYKRQTSAWPMTTSS